MNPLISVSNLSSKKTVKTDNNFFFIKMDEKITSPWFSRNVDEIKNKELLKYFRGERTGFIQVGPKKYFLPHNFGKGGEKYFWFEPRPSDTWVVSFPRSGTTWTQEMVWLLCNNLDYKKSANVPLVERFPFLEFDSCVDNEVLNEFLSKAENEETKKNLLKACGPVLEELESMTEPRFIKSHLPFSLLHPNLLTCGAKVVYVARNPKDVAVSYYHFHQFIKTLDYVGNFETFWNFFEQNLELWTPYWEHLKEGWEQRDNPNLLFLFYEDLKQDLKVGINKVAKFLRKQYNDNDLEDLMCHLEFNNFQKNASVNMEVLRGLGMLSNCNQRCIRKGKSGGWKELFTPELNEQANRWIRENLEKTNIIFPYHFKFLTEL